jgi:hypothetical protein
MTQDVQTQQTVEITPITTDAPEVEAQDVVQEETTEDAEPSDDTAPGEDVDGELKTVRKALDKRNRYINNQRNRIRALEAEMAKLRDGFSKNTQTAPQLEKFDSVIDYMKADNNYSLEQKLAEQAHNAKLEMLEQQQNMAIEQRTQEVATQVQELLTSNADFAKTVRAAEHVINAMPPHVERLMMEIDNAPAATYALVKEGRLQDLYYMPPEIAAAHLVQAEIRGQQYLQQSAPKQTQQAPKPIGKLNGSGKSSSKTVDDMNPNELMKWLNT